MEFKCIGCGNCCKDYKPGPGLNVFYWEAKMFENYYPFPVVYDKKNNVNVALSWTVPLDKCPFLKSNGCAVYEKRPLVCRSYPVLSSGLSNRNKKLKICTNCSRSDFLKGLIDKLRVEKDKHRRVFILKKALGESYLSALQLELTYDFINKELAKMDYKGLTEIENKMVEDKLVIDVFDLMLRTRHISENELSRIIYDIQNLNHAKRLLNRY